MRDTVRSHSVQLQRRGQNPRTCEHMYIDDNDTVWSRRSDGGEAEKKTIDRKKKKKKKKESIFRTEDKGQDHRKVADVQRMKVQGREGKETQSGEGG